MKVRKSLFSFVGIAILAGGSYCTERANVKVFSGPQLVADGGDPMPRPPRGTLVATDEVAVNALVADGGDPMPLPKPTRGGSIAAVQQATGVLVADGGDPMPRPPRKLA